MKLNIQSLAFSAVLLGAASVAMAADQSSAEKERQAISVLKSSAPPAEKALACKRLAVYGNADAVPALTPLLADPELSSWSRIALEVIPGREADEALRNAMDKLQGRLLVGVINSIGVRRDAKAVSGLTTKLQDADAEVASAAAVALGRIGGDPAAKALEKLLGSAPAGSRSAVAQGCILCAEHYLAEKKTDKAIKLYDAVRGADVPKQRVLEGTRGAILARGSESLPILLEALRSPDKGLFGIGLSTSREVPGRAITEALAAELSKAPAERQGPLLLALADRKDAAALPAVLSVAKSGATPLRLVAIESLVRLGDRACVPVLLDALAESDAELTQAAKGGLVALPGKEVDDQIVARLQQGAGGARRALVELAGQRHITAATPELVKASSDSDPAIRGAGIKALGETVSVAELNTLIDLLAKAKTADEVGSVQEALESACSRLPDKAACAAKLLPYLTTSPVAAKCALLRVLGTVATPSAFEAVKAAVANPEPSVKDTAIRVVADWPEATALPLLLDLLRTSENETHRFLAVRGCVRLLNQGAQPAGEAVKTYAELIARTQRSDDRKVLLSGLANVADPAALKLVEPFLNDPQVRAEAELAMLNIASGIARSAPNDAKAAAARVKAQSENKATRDRATKILSQIEGS